MPDLTLSSTMDAFLAETDALVTPHGIKDISDVLSIDTNTRMLHDSSGTTVMEWANIADPVFFNYGAVMNVGTGVNFDNGSRVKEGITDAGEGGLKGVALVCSLDYEFKWEAGRLYVMGQDGFTIRVEQYGFTDIPDANDDDSKGYIVGSRRILDDGTTYLCTDATTGAAVWQISGSVPYTGASADLDLTGYNLEFSSSNSWYDGTTIGHNATTAIDIANRQLIANDGSTAMLEWSAYGVNIPSSVYLGVDMIYDADVPQRYIDMVNGIMGEYGMSYTPSLDWYNRQLIGTDGSTIAADWSTGTPDFPLGLTANAEISTSTGGFNDAGVGGYVSSSGDPSYHPSGVRLAPTAVASLVNTQEGSINYVNDADTPVIGSAVVGSGSAKCLVCYNGTDWIVTSLL